ncbi:myosin heavy chain, clone 203-like isoform X2 [Periplaneta americana]|uniref:myosin heavy chain, clone 203-like isoform X2 n=1 Tax=Periplaneta americana TaxID=6978 RepID=UPI0037E96CE5
MIAENLLSLQTDPCVIFLSLLTLLQSLNSVFMNLTRQLDEEFSDMETTTPNLVNTFQNPLNVHLALSHILTLVTMNHDDENERINLLATQHNTRYEDYQKVKKIWKQREEDLEKELGGLTTYKDWCSRNMSLLEQEIRKCNETASRLHTTAEKYDDLKNEVSKYKTDIALVSLNLSHCELREETLRNERAEAKKKLEDSESDVALLQQDLQDERKSLAEEMKKCSEMKANYTNEVEKLDTLLRDKTKNSTNLLKSVNDLTEEIENLKRDLKSEQAKLLKTSKDLQDKESEVKEFSTFLENEKYKVNNLTQNIKAVRENCSNEITAINLQLRNKEKELQKEKKNFTKLQTQTVQLEAKVNQTEKELETEKNNSSSLEKSLNRTAERAGRYTDLHRQCSKRLSNYMGETRNLNIKLHLAEKELQDKKSEVAKCKEKLKETKMSLEEYKEEMFELNALRKENKEYEKQLGAERLQLDDIVLQSWKLLSQVKTMSCASCNLERELKHINVTKLCSREVQSGMVAVHVTTYPFEICEMPSQPHYKT